MLGNTIVMEFICSYVPDTLNVFVLDIASHHVMADYHFLSSLVVHGRPSHTLCSKGGVGQRDGRHAQIIIPRLP